MWKRLAVFLLSVTGALVYRLGIADDPTLWFRCVTALSGIATLFAVRCSLLSQPRLIHYGSAGFATPQEITDLLLPQQSVLPKGNILLGKLSGSISSRQQVALPLPFTSQHGVIVGGSGSGKSFSFFLPNVAATSNWGLSSNGTENRYKEPPTPRLRLKPPTARRIGIIRSCLRQPCAIVSLNRRAREPKTERIMQKSVLFIWRVGITQRS